MTDYGAYNSESVYTREDVREIIAHATYRGVRILPELDQPAHVAHGWTWPEAVEKKYTVCVDYEPWYELCVEPPCGQVNISSRTRKFSIS